MKIAGKLWLGLAVLFAGGSFAFAAPNSAKIVTPDVHVQGEAGERGKVIRVIDGDSLVIDAGEAGEINVSLAGIETPKFAWPDKGYVAWPLAGAAKQHLRGLTLGKTVQLYYSGDTRDRYGQATSQVHIVGTDIWLQEAMVRAGYARVYSWTSHALDAARLYTSEVQARAAKRGIWDTTNTGGFYDIRTPDPNPLAQYVDSVQIVEGIIISAADVRGTVYLNFGSDYKTDFTVAVSKKNAKKFAKQGFEPLTLEGAKVRVRGWIELRNGPIIWLSDLKRLEVLD